MARGIAVNRSGEAIPVLTPLSAGGVLIDGTAAHAESSVLQSGIYRMVVETSAADDTHVYISTAGTAATASNGFYMPKGAIEYFFLDQASIVSVLNGILNIVQTS